MVWGKILMKQYKAVTLEIGMSLKALSIKNDNNRKLSDPYCVAFIVVFDSSHHAR